MPVSSTVFHASAMKHAVLWAHSICSTCTVSCHGLSNITKPCPTAPTEDRGKTSFGFSRNRVWSTLNASENPSLKYKMNKLGNTQLWSVRIRSKQPVSRKDKSNSLDRTRHSKQTMFYFKNSLWKPIWDFLHYSSHSAITEVSQVTPWQWNTPASWHFCIFGMWK